jgi:polyisoprenoid-binding protein YceI
MKKTVLAAFAVISLGTALYATHVPEGNYTIDSYHSKVGFEVPHLVVSSVEGRFNAFSGTVTVVKDNVEVATDIDINSVDTGIGKRDEHLKSADFFDVATYPKMTFKSKKIVWKKNNFKLIGDLTLHGVTKEVVLNGKYNGAVKDQFGSDKIVAVAEGKISRKDYGLVWNKAVEAGPVVGDEITLSFKIEASKNK